MNVRPMVLAMALALVACNGGEDDPKSERKTAAGEVLGGSISDAMLPLDTIASQSPPLGAAGNGTEMAGENDNDPATDPPSRAQEEGGSLPRKPASSPSSVATADASEEAAQ